MQLRLQNQFHTGLVSLRIAKSGPGEMGRQMKGLALRTRVQSAPVMPALL